MWEVLLSPLLRQSKWREREQKSEPKDEVKCDLVTLFHPSVDLLSSFHLLFFYSLSITFFPFHFPSFSLSSSSVSFSIQFTHKNLFLSHYFTLSSSFWLLFLPSYSFYSIYLFHRSFTTSIFSSSFLCRHIKLYDTWLMSFHFIFIHSPSLSSSFFRLSNPFLCRISFFILSFLIPILLLFSLDVVQWLFSTPHPISVSDSMAVTWYFPNHF